MAPGIHPFASAFVAARLETPAERAAREKSASGDLIRSIALSALPLVGLMVGVVSVALWTAH